MNHEKTSDFEINKRIFPHTRDYNKCEDVMEQKNPNKDALMWGDGTNWFEFNPCNSWADMGPLIVEHEITILFDGDSVEVSYEFDGIESVHGTDETLSHYISGDKKDILRMAAICYLKLMQNKVNK